MMNSKYYTPDISELYIGAEYEQANFIGKTFSGNWSEEDILKEVNHWDKKVMKTLQEPGLGYYHYHPHLPWTRIKYLDTEDIESLGWKPFDSRKNSFYIVKGLGEQYELEFENKRFTINYIDHTDDYEKTEYVFKGVIKNKSILNTIMKQVGIL